MLYGIFSIQQSTLERIAQAVQSGRISLKTAENRDAEETMALLHEGIEE